jgi:lipoprotein-anchoring transpeptidase ErfK/SrfK
MSRRRATVSLIGMLAVAGMLATGCSGGETPVASGSERGERGAASDDKPAPKAEISVSPKAGATKVRPDEPVTVSVENGTLTDVAVTDRDGEPVPGEFDKAKTAWVSSVGLVGDAAYRVRAEAENTEGKLSKTDQGFRTLTPSGILGTDIIPLSGTTFGIGQPIIVTFSHPTTAKVRADLEERLRIETSKSVKGAWHWFSDQEVHYRPKDYWPAHTDITLRINTKGATNGDGAWGIRNKVKHFEVGRSVRTKVNLYDHQAKVFVDGKLARTIPVTGGQAGWETRNGTKVVLDKELDKTFTDEQIDAEEDYELFSPYAVRITWSGEFLHTAEWSTWAHGSQNVSHGCVGMSYDNSKWLWNVSKIGDPVEVKSSGPPMDVRGNGYGDWNMSWKEWKAGSALAG